MILEALAITLCVRVIGSPCAPCEIPVAAQGTPVVRCMPVSREFMSEAVPLISCESSWRWDAIGDHGQAHGLLQVRVDVHGKRMREIGLDPNKEADRWQYAEQVLWAEQGVAPWSCASLQRGGVMGLRYSPFANATYSRQFGHLYTNRGAGSGNWPKDIPPGRYRVSFEPIEEEP